MKASINNWIFICWIFLGLGNQYSVSWAQQGLFEVIQPEEYGLLIEEDLSLYGLIGLINMADTPVLLNQVFGTRSDESYSFLMEGNCQSPLAPGMITMIKYHTERLKKREPEGNEWDNFCSFMTVSECENGKVKGHRETLSFRRCDVTIDSIDRVELPVRSDFKLSFKNFQSTRSRLNDTTILVSGMLELKNVSNRNFWFAKEQGLDFNYLKLENPLGEGHTIRSGKRFLLLYAFNLPEKQSGESIKLPIRLHFQSVDNKNHIDFKLKLKPN